MWKIPFDFITRHTYRGSLGGSNTITLREEDSALFENHWRIGGVARSGMAATVVLMVVGRVGIGGPSVPCEEARVVLMVVGSVGGPSGMVGVV